MYLIYIIYYIITIIIYTYNVIIILLYIIIYIHTCTHISVDILVSYMSEDINPHKPTLFGVFTNL